MQAGEMKANVKCLFNAMTHRQFVISCSSRKKKANRRTICIFRQAPEWRWRKCRNEIIHVETRRGNEWENKILNYFVYFMSAINSDNLFTLLGIRTLRRNSFISILQLYLLLDFSSNGKNGMWNDVVWYDEMCLGADWFTNYSNDFSFRFFSLGKMINFKFELYFSSHWDTAALRYWWQSKYWTTQYSI